MAVFRGARGLVGMAAVAAAGAVALRVRAWIAAGEHLNLGATPDEQAAELPGDELIPDAGTVATRAIDIDAPVDYVWPWVAQLGQDRGGFYTYTLLENVVGLGITNADSIVAEWQHPQVGDPFRMAADLVLQVAIVDAPEAFVVRSPEDGPARPGPGFDFSWAFVVRPRPDGHGVRLVVRERYRAVDATAGPAIGVAGVVSTLMTHGMLNGIRGRAERLFESGI